MRRRRGPCPIIFSRFLLPESRRHVAALYEKTIAYLLQYIDENGLQSGDQLPTEARLAQLAGVSLVTVRRALSELATQSVVRREQGRGTFVCGRACAPRPRAWAGCATAS